MRPQLEAIPSGAVSVRSLLCAVHRTCIVTLSDLARCPVEAEPAPVMASTSAMLIPLALTRATAQCSAAEATPSAPDTVRATQAQVVMGLVTSPGYLVATLAVTPVKPRQMSIRRVIQMTTSTAVRTP